MGDLEKMQPRPWERVFFRASGRKWTCARKLRPTAGSLRSDGRQGAKPAARRSARGSLRVLDCLLAPASVPLWGSGRSPPLYRTTRRSEEHTSELQSRLHLVCRLLLEKKNIQYVMLMSHIILLTIPPSDIV